jgi:hypothetical protein
MLRVFNYSTIPDHNDVMKTADVNVPNDQTLLVSKDMMTGI